MSKKFCKGRKVVSLMMSAAAAMSINIALLSSARVKVKAAESTKAIVFDTSVLEKNVNTSKAATVYYGVYENRPLPWRVISYDGYGAVTFRDATYDAVTLYSDGSLFRSEFNTDPAKCNAYKDSTLQAAVHAFTSNAVTNNERGAILRRDFGVGMYTDHPVYCSGVLGSPVWDQYFWPLTTDEAVKLDHGLRARGDYTALISPGKPANPNDVNVIGNKVACVYKSSDTTWDVSVDGFDANDCYNVRLAFSLWFKNIAMLSASEKGTGKVSGEVGPDCLKAVSDYEISSDNSWKVTLKDGGRGSFTASRDDDGAAVSGRTVSIKYDNAKSGDNEFVSVILADASDPNTALYYGNIAKDSVSGTAELKIPEGLTGEYVLKVFSEQCNGARRTDYASGFREIKLTVVEAAVVSEAAAGAENLVYNGKEQTLVSAGKTVNGTMQYKLGEDGTYSEKLPTAKNAGEYKVFYKAAGASGYADSYEKSVSVVIAKAQAKVTPNNISKTLGQADPALTATISGLAEGDKADVISYTISRVEGEKEGIYQINTDGKKDQGNYEVTFATGALTIAEGEIIYTVSDNMGGAYTNGCNKDLVVTVKRNVNDEKTFDNYQGSTMDGKEITKDQGTATKGSLVLTVKSSYLDTLPEGKHTVKVSFIDGEATAEINISKPQEKTEPQEKKESKEKSIPKTGDTSKDNSRLATGLIIISALGIAIVVISSKKRHD